MPRKLSQVLPHGVMLAASIVLYWLAAGIDVDTGGRISPAVWPKAVIVIMGLLCAYEIVKRLLARSQFTATGVLSTDPLGVGREAALPLNLPMLFGGIALIAAYVVAVPYTGFFLTTALFLGIFPRIGGMQRPLLCAAIGVAGSLALAVVFMRIAYISLPLGDGAFRALSLALMRAIGVT
ncbi:MAG: tripartite tricarboxylate transporter TctB family protein [Usitatibacter sp.]